MTKATKYNFTKMNQDIVESKHSPDQYYSAENLRFITNGDKVTGAFSFEKGNKLSTSIPDITLNNSNKTIIYGTTTLTYNTNELSTLSSTDDQIIIGSVVARDSYILFSTNDSGEDCIWEVQNSDNTIKLLYFRNLGFSTSNPIQALFNYENEDIQKIYWVDGVNQIRFLNIKHENIEGNSKLIDVPANTLNFVGNVEFSQPKVTDSSSGGNHTSGMIQYAYNLYRLNSSQSKLSPLSELVSLDKGENNGGGEVNEVVGTTPIIKIEDIDSSYTHIKVYSVKYTSYNQLPEVNLIEERELDNQTSITIYDDGSSIANITIEELLFLGSTPIIPQHIESKDNILFPSNIKEQFFDIPSELDMRAFSFNGISDCIVYDNVRPSTSGSPIGNPYNVVSPNFVVPKNHDAVNLNYDSYKYQENGITFGGEGKYIKYELVQKSLSGNNIKVFKDNEIYRIGIQFYNNLGQITPAKWIADFKSPQGNLSGSYNTLKVTLKPALLTEFNSLTGKDKPIGYKILRADRTLNDRTIIDQGILSPTMFQVKGDNAKNEEAFESELIRVNYQDQELKVPSYLTRTFEKFPDEGTLDSNGGVLGPTKHLRWLSGTRDTSGGLDEGGEIYNNVAKAGKIQQSFLHSKLMNFYSPEILLDIQNNFSNGLELRVVGEAINAEQDNGVWGSEIVIDTQTERWGGKTLSGVNVHKVDSNLYEIDNRFSNLHQPTEYNDGSNASFQYSFIGPGGEEVTMDFYQYYRGYTSNFIYNSSSTQYRIYGSPEIAERGQGSTNYNGDPRYRYANSLQSIICDGEDGGLDDNPPLSGINSFGCKSAFIVLGNTSDDTSERFSIEDLYNASSLSNDAGILVTEIVTDANYIYLSGIYGGNSYEDKKRTNYIEIGDYSSINDSTIQIDNPGDTFIQIFRFARIAKTDTEIYSNTQQQITEIVEYKTETSVDLKNRNDLSIFNWDSRFQPRDSEYHKYNRVYSQQPTLIKNNSFDFTFRRIKNFDTRVVASKTKIPNENVDSWTDILENTSMDLDGKYGPINSIINYKDNLYTFQDNAFAVLNINPRVQTQGNDGISIELGRGDTLYDYQYISNKTGSINKWGIQVTKGHIYFLDGLNKTFYRFNSNGLENISTTKGMHKYFYDNLNVQTLRLDNPILSTGVSIGYNQINNEIYLTYNNEWTLCFNELQDGFSSFYSYNSPFYIYNKEKMLTVNATGINTLYTMHEGDYNIFYGENKQSKINFLANPEPDHEVVFNNLEYRAQATDSSNADINYTWEKIKVYNEFQNSGIVNPKLRKLNRAHRIVIPRNQNSTDRIRNNWCYIELSSNNINKYSYTNNDIILYYNPRYVLIR